MDSSSISSVALYTLDQLIATTETYVDNWLMGLSIGLGFLLVFVGVFVHDYLEKNRTTQRNMEKLENRIQQLEQEKRYGA